MEKINLGYGYSAEDEDMIVGTKDGLEALKRAINEALESKEAKLEKDEDEYCEICGVKVVDESYFNYEEDNDSTFSSTIGVIATILFFLITFIVGFIQIIRWIISLFY